MLIVLSILQAAALASTAPAGPAALPVGEILCRSGVQANRSIATVIENRWTLLAAGHFDSLGEVKFRPDQCRFTLRNGQRKIVFSSRFTMVASGGPAAVRRHSPAVDWAVLELAEPVPATIQPLTLHYANEAGRREEILIPQGSGAHGILRCTIWPSAPTSVIAHHDCATRAGWSGAPLLARFGEEWRVVGIHFGSLPKAAGAARQPAAVSFTGKLAARMERTLRPTPAKEAGSNEF